MNVLRNSLRKGVTRQPFTVSMGSWEESMLPVMLFETTKSRVTEAIKMKERVFANSDGPKLEIASGASASLRSSAFVTSKRLVIS